MMAAPQHGNGPNPERTQQCVDRIEAIDDKKERAHMAYMAECATFAAEKKEVYEEAKSAWSLPVRSLKAVVKERSLLRKIEGLRDHLEGDDQETYDQIKNALGMLADTPLGRAVTGDDDQDLRGSDQKDKEAFRKERGKKGGRKGDDALNAAATEGAPADNGASQLATGIKPLH